MPRSRVRVLEALLLDPGPHSFYLRELARASSVALQAVQRELATLADLGVVSRAPRGREVYFLVQDAHPLVRPLRTLLRVAGGTAPPPPDREAAIEPPAPPPPGTESWRVW